MGDPLFVDHTTLMHRGILGGKVRETFNAIESHVPTEERPIAIAYAFNEFSKRNPSEAADLAFRDFGKSPDLGLFLKNILRQWRSTDASAMENWMNNLNEERKAVVQSVFSDL